MVVVVGGVGREGGLGLIIHSRLGLDRLSVVLYSCQGDDR